MRQESLFQIVDYDKFPELVALYNAWWNKTAFMSVGNCSVPEWDALVDYGKEHPKEVAEFIYDMFENNIEVNWPQMALYNEAIGKAVIQSDHYINPMCEDVQNMYKLICGIHCGRIKGGKVLV